MLSLYYYPDNASLAPHFLLAEAGAEYELRLVDRRSLAQKSPDYLRLNPAGRIPTLVDGDLVLFESPAICIHIAERFPAAGLIPLPGNPDRPRFFQWLAYLNNTLQAEFMLWNYPDQHTDDPSGASGIIAAQDRRLGDVLALLDDQLAKGRYLLGQTFSACDPFLFMLASWCENVSRPPLSFPHLARHMREMAARPAIRKVCAIEGIDLSPYI